jgi:uncharacterized protein YecT (DUF1311 family)
MPSIRSAVGFAVLLVGVIGPHAAWAAADQDYDRMYGDCLKEAGATNNGTVTACAEATTDSAKKEMNALYQRLHERLATESPGDADKLERSQKAWLAYRNSQCELAGSYVGSPMYSFCPMKLNIARVHELRELAGGG